MGHKIFIRCEKGVFEYKAIRLIKSSILTALDAEGVDIPCAVEVTLTDDKRIHALNKQFRNVDRPTDVLSFPMQELKPGIFAADPGEITPDGFLPIGDIVISVERAKAQAVEYGHSTEREISYLTVHSVLHLLGYDHVDEGEQKKEMRSREDVIMDKLGISL